LKNIHILISKILSFVSFFPPVLAPFPFPLSSCSAITQGLTSLSLTYVPRGTLCWFGLSFYCEEGREEKHAAKHAVVADDYGKRKSHLLSLFTFILSIK